MALLIGIEPGESRADAAAATRARRKAMADPAALPPHRLLQVAAGMPRIAAGQRVTQAALAAALDAAAIRPTKAAVEALRGAREALRGAAAASVAARRAVRRRLTRPGEIHMMYRQGDVLLIAIDPPAETPAAGREATAAILAYGEATGRHHVLHGRAVYYAHTEAGGRLIDLRGPGELRHQLADGAQAEHDPIRLPPGWYRQIQQHEYVEPTQFSPPRRRRVAD